MKHRGKSFFDEEFRLSALSTKGDSLEKLNETIEWELFRAPVEKGMYKKAREDGKGPPPNDAVLMFKTLVLRELYQLSDDDIEYQILRSFEFSAVFGTPIIR